MHWVGAGAGGIAGMVYGWSSARRKYRGPLHPEAKRRVVLGGLLGVAVTALLLILLGSAGRNSLLIIVAFVPVLVFVPPGMGMMLGALIGRRKMARKVDDQGVYCVHCLYDLRGSIESGRCPECGEVFSPFKARKGIHFGVRAAWRATWMGLLGSAIGAIIGYGLIVLFLG